MKSGRDGGMRWAALRSIGGLAMLLVVSGGPCGLLAQADGETGDAGDSDVPGGIVAIIGDDVITQSELDVRLLRDVLAQGETMSLDDIRRFKPRLEHMVLERMIDDVLMLQEAGRRVEEARRSREKDKDDEKKSSPSVRGTSAQTWEPLIKRFVTDGEVDRSVEDRMQELQARGLNLSTPQAFYDEVMRETGLTRDQIRGQIRRELAIQKFLWQSVFNSIDPFVKPKELEYYYEKNQDEFTKPVELSFRQIHVLNAGRNTGRVVQEIERRLGAARAEPEKKLEEEFISLAREFSRDFDDDLRGQVQTKSYEVIQEYRRPVPEVLSGLARGQASGPVYAGGNVLYFYLVDRVEGKPKVFEDAQEEIAAKILQDRRERAYRRFLGHLRDDTFIRVLLPELPGEAAGK